MRREMRKGVENMGDIRILKIWVLLGIMGGYSWEDIRKHSISVKYLAFPTALGLALHIWGNDSTWVSMALGIAVGAGILVLAAATGGRIGPGDGLLLVVTGIYLGGAGNFQLLMYGLLYAALASLTLLVLRKWHRNRELPFVPFLFLGYLTMIAGEAVC